MKALFVLLVAAACCSIAHGAAVNLTEASVQLDPPDRDIPQTVWFQGFVVDSSSGEPVNATHDIVAEIFDAVTGGASQWGPESHAATSIVDGWFSFELGETVDLPTFGTPPYYLQLTINGETLAPRQKLGSVPASFRSARTDDVDPDWYYSGPNIYRLSGFTGIGTATPERDLDVAGTARMDAFEMVPGAADGRVLTSDASGVGTWQSPSGGGGLDLPYSGSISHTASAFSVDNTNSGTSAAAINGKHTISGNYGRLGTGGAGVLGAGSSGLAGQFEGDVYVDETFGVGVLPSEARLGVVANATYGSGIYANQISTAGAHHGVLAYASSPDGAAVYGETNADSSGVGVHGVGTSPFSVGVLGEGPYHGVRGVNTNTGAEGILGVGSTGIYGAADTPGKAGHFAGDVLISQDLSVGTLDNEARLTVVSTGGAAVYGRADVLDTSAHYGVYGETPSWDGYGVYGESPFIGVEGGNTDTGAYGRLGYGSIGVWGWAGSGGGAAGVFEGRVDIDGDLGIGISSPASELDIDGLACIRGYGWPAAETGASMELAYNPSFHRGYIQIYDRDTGGSEWGQLFLGADFVGIGAGVDYSHALDVMGDVQCVALHETSDGRLKSDVRQLTDVLEAVGRLRGVSFEWNEEAESAGATPGARGIGVIAEEVREVFPELVSAPEGSHMAVDYSKLTAVLIEAVKELRSENEALRARVDALEASGR